MHTTLCSFSDKHTAHMQKNWVGNQDFLDFAFQPMQRESYLSTCFDEASTLLLGRRCFRLMPNI